MITRNAIKFLKHSRTVLLFQKPTHLAALRGIHVQKCYVLSQHQVNNLTLKCINFSTKPLSATTNQKPPLIDSEQHLEKLRTELTTFGFVSTETLSKAIEATAFNLSEVESNFLLDSCACLIPSEKLVTKLELFHKIWDAIKENGTPTKEHYVKAAKVLRDQTAPFKEFQKLLSGCPFRNDLEIYERLLYLAAEEGDVEKSNDLITEIRGNNLKLTENMFNALILTHSKVGNLSECKNVLETMNAANLFPNYETYTELIVAHVLNNDEQEAEKLLTEHGSSLRVNQLVQIMRMAALKKMPRLIEKCLKYESNVFMNVKEIPLAVRKICIELIYEGHPDEAFLIVNSFPKPIFGENQDIDTFGTFLIFEFIKSGQNAKKTIEICQDLIASEKNTRALHIACEIAIRKNSNKSLEYLRALSELEPLRPHYFWPIILQRFRTDGEMGIVDTIKAMTELKVDCDYETIAFYILPRMSITLTNAKKAIKILEESGLKTSQFMTPLITQLIFQQKFDEVISLLELYQTKINTENLGYSLTQMAGSIKATKTYSQLIKLLKILKSKAQNPNYDFIGYLLIEIISHPKYKNDSQAIVNLITEFHRNNLKISRTAADVIHGNLQKNDLKSILFKMVDDNLNLPSQEFHGSNIAHPRDMNLDELECHLVELESKNLNTRGVLRRLLQMCVREGKYKRALEIKEKCDKLKVQVSPGMMASIFDMYVKLKRGEDAEKYFGQIKKAFPGFLLDEYKIVDYAALLIQNNRLEDAKKVLKSRLNTSKIFGGEHIQKNIWQLLDNAANLSLQSSKLEPNQNQTKEMFNMLQKLGYCVPHNTLLGPIIREYILRKDIRSAVTEFKEYAETYKKTPLQLELITLLVSLSNEKNTDEFNITSNEAKQLLQEVIQCGTSVHGVVNVNGTLVIAVADAGTEGQLRKLLIDPNFRFNADTLLRNCEHLSNSGKIETLLKLAKASRGLRHVIKEHNLYDILLNHFIKVNNYEAALELYEKLNNDDELKITQEFIKNLTNLLKMNNYEIPSSLALRAQIM